MMSWLCGGCGGYAGFEEIAPVEPTLEVARHGLVALESRLPNLERGPRLHAAAYFWQASPEESTGCSLVEVIDGCEISECIPVEAAAIPLPGFAWLSAGVVDVVGTKLDFSFTESARGDYATTLPTTDMSLWDGGESLGVVVSGSEDFPPLEAALTAPRPVVLDAPHREETRLEPGSDLLFEWSSPRLDSVYVEIEERRATPYAPPLERVARCSFSAESGRGTIPAAVFDDFSDPAELDGYRFRVSTDSQQELDVNGATFTFLALSAADAFELPLSHGTHPSSD